MIDLWLGRLRRNEFYVVGGTDDAVDIPGDGLGLVALILPACRPGQGDPAGNSLRVNRGRHDAVDHQRLQHHAAQISVLALRLVQQMHLQFVDHADDPGNAPCVVRRVALFRLAADRPA